MATVYPPEPAQYGQPQQQETHVQMQQYGNQQYGNQYGQPGMPQVVVQAPPRPNNYMVFSVLSCLFCNCCCGLPAIIYSSATDDEFNRGQYQLALEKSQNAKKCAIAAFISGTIWIIGVIIFLIIWFAVVVPAAMAAVSQSRWNNNNNNWWDK